MNEFTAKIQAASDGSKIDEGERRAADSVATAGGTAARAASKLVSDSAEALQGHASEFVDSAKTIASDVGNRLQQTVNEQKGAGAEYVSRLAHSIDRAADQVDRDFPLAGSYMRSAASQVQTAADALRSGNVDDLIEGAKAFAKRQPTLFLGIAFLAGFGAVRFLKSSASTASSDAPINGNGNSRSGAKSGVSDFATSEAP
jgi:gas vesicle protein